MPFALRPEQRGYRTEVADRMSVARLKVAAANHEAVAFAQDVATAAQAEIDTKSRRWRTTRSGRAAETWVQQWRDFAAAATEIDAVDRFNALPDSAATE